MSQCRRYRREAIRVHFRGMRETFPPAGPTEKAHGGARYGTPREGENKGRCDSLSESLAVMTFIEIPTVSLLHDAICHAEITYSPRDEGCAIAFESSGALQLVRVVVRYGL